MDRRLQGLAMAFVAYASWGLLAPVGQILLLDFGPMGLNAVRMVIAATIVVVIAGPTHVREGLRMLRSKELVALLLVGGGIDFTLYTFALTYLDATYAALGFYTAPLWTAVLAKVYLRERAGRWFLPAVAAMLLGAWLTLFGGAVPRDGFHAGGMALAVAAGLGWGVYAVGLRRAAGDADLRALSVAWFVVTAAYFVVAAALLEGTPPIASVSPAAWGWMAVYVLAPTVAALFLFNAALQRAPAGMVNMLVAAELAATMLFSWLLLGDTFDGIQAIGLGIVMAAVSGYLWTRR